MPVLIPGPGQDPLPAADDALEQWADNFDSNYDPLNFGTTVPVVDYANAAFEAFRAALATASNPSTRTTSTVATKNATRAALEPLLRQGVRVCVTQFLAGAATESSLTDLGIRVPKTTRTPIGAPVDNPLIEVASLSPSVVSIRVTQQVDGAPVTDRRFPAGVATLELSSRPVGGDWALLQTVKRVNIAANVGAFADGSVRDYRARYVSPRGDTGPWSPVVTAPVWNPA